MANYDPHWKSVQLLLQGNGANNGTVFTDSSINAIPISIGAGSPVTSTSQVKFGTSSIHIPDGAYLAAPGYTPALDLTDDFTLDCWIYLVGSADPEWMLCGSQGLNNQFHFGDTNFGMYINGGTSWVINHGGSMSAGSWKFFELSRSGSTIRLWIDGVYKGSTTTSAVISFGSGGFHLGQTYDKAAEFYVDDFRITKVARHSTNDNYSVPTEGAGTTDFSFESTLPKVTSSFQFYEQLTFSGLLPEPTASMLLLEVRVVDFAKSLPTPSSSITCLLGSFGDLNADLPKIEASFEAGVQEFSPSLPALSCSFDAFNGGIVSFASKLSPLTGEFDGQVASVGVFSVTIPSVECELDGYQGKIGILNGFLPKLNAVFESASGRSGEFEVDLPKIKSSFSTYTISQATLRAKLPKLRASCRSF